MSVYSFGQHSLIREVSVVRSEGGGIRAYVYAREDAEPAALDSVKKLLTANAMQWSPIQTGGGGALEIRGLGKDDNHLLRLLSVNNAVAGGYKKEPSVGDVMSFRDKFRKNTLRASGIFYSVGDLGFIAYGWKEAYEKKKLTKPQLLLAGIFYALGTPVITFFGRGDKSDFQLKDISHYTIQELKRQGIIVPEDSAIRAVANGHNEGVFRKTYNFFERYPAEITNSFFGVAGAMMFWSGIRDYIARKKGEPRSTMLIDIGIGVMTMLSGLVSVFVEEEVPDPNEPKKHGLARAWQYIKEKPLRTAGIALGISTLGHVGATAIGWKDAKVVLADEQNYSADKIEKAKKLKSALPGRAVFAATNLTAEALMAVSSKGHGAGVKTDTSLDRSVYAVMADLVQRSPQANRDLLLAKLSEFLSDKKHLGGRAADIENGIRDQLKAMAKNPWAGAAKPRLAETPAKPEPKTSWRERTTQTQSPAPLAPAMI